MTNTDDGEPTGEAKKKKAPAKKAPAKAKAAKKPAAKKPAAKKPARKKTQPIQVVDVAEAPELIEAQVDVVDVPNDDDIEDAEVIAETPLEASEAAGLDEEDLPELTPEEQELQAIYGEDLAKPAQAHGEYRDSKTADEDRPMMPEINARAERKQQWQDRRDRRKNRREERDRARQERRESRDRGPANGQPHGGGEQRPHGDRPHGDRPQHAQSQPYQAQQQHRPMQPPVQIEAVDNDPLARVGTPLGDAAATVFAQLRNGQPLPVRQLAAMMRKRNLVEADPEQLAPQLKAELLGDERSYRTLGLRPRIVYRGRDLFAPGPVAMSQTADAEAGIATALSRLAGATHRALAVRMAKASPAGFERLIHAYLVAAGYREITWVKRIGGISYAQATAPGIERSVLISARSGNEPIDRRGIGELRVGVEAKNLVAGFLFSVADLSEDAEKELERAGRSIAVICGDQLVATLINAGVGVVSAAAPLHYVDDQLLDELLAG
ncbi:MAG: restriction endonuclease [Kofleriaceae bacterium]